MPFMFHLVDYDFTLVLLQHSGFHKLSFHNFISKIPQCDTLCSYTPLQFHVLYTLSGPGRYRDNEFIHDEDIDYV